jgi:hypothetical protein
MQSVFLSFWMIFSSFTEYKDKSLSRLKCTKRVFIDFYRLQRTAEREEFKDFKEKPVWRYSYQMWAYMLSIQLASNYFEAAGSALMKSKL